MGQTSVISYRERQVAKGRGRLDNMSGMAAIAGVCVLVLLIVTKGKKAEIAINFLLRAVTGAVGIYFINFFLAAQHLAVSVGINPVTLLTSGFLGFPGVAVLYGISFFENL